MHVEIGDKKDGMKSSENEDGQQQKIWPPTIHGEKRYTNAHNCTTSTSRRGGTTMTILEFIESSTEKAHRQAQAAAVAAAAAADCQNQQGGADDANGSNKKMPTNMNGTTTTGAAVGHHHHAGRNDTVTAATIGATAAGDNEIGQRLPPSLAHAQQQQKELLGLDDDQQLHDDGTSTTRRGALAVAAVKMAADTVTAPYEYHLFRPLGGSRQDLAILACAFMWLRTTARTPPRQSAFSSSKAEEDQILDPTLDQSSHKSDEPPPLLYNALLLEHHHLDILPPDVLDVPLALLCAPPIIRNADELSAYITKCDPRIQVAARFRWEWEESGDKMIKQQRSDFCSDGAGGEQSSHLISFTVIDKPSFAFSSSSSKRTQEGCHRRRGLEDSNSPNPPPTTASGSVPTETIALESRVDNWHFSPSSSGQSASAVAWQKNQTHLRYNTLYDTYIAPQYKVKAFLEGGSQQVFPVNFLSKCRDMTTIDLSGIPHYYPKTMTSVGKGFLEACSGLTEIRGQLPRHLTSVGDRFLADCTALTSLDLATLAPALTRVGCGFLYYCRHLRQISLPDTLTVVYDDFMSSCRDLLEISLDVTELGSIGHNFLSGCTSLRRAHFFSSSTVPDDDGVKPATSSSDPPFLKEVGMAHLPNWFMSGCTSLTELDLSDLRSVISTGSFCLRSCVSLQKIVLPPKLEEVGDGFMAECVSIETLDFRRTTPGLKRVADSFLEDCSALTELNLNLPLPLPLPDDEETGEFRFGRKFLHGTKLPSAFKSKEMPHQKLRPPSVGDKVIYRMNQIFRYVRSRVAPSEREQCGTV